MSLDHVLLGLELIGTFAFAISGALLAARKGFDVVGSVLLASLAGLGGGVIRDLILDSGPPTAFTLPLLLVPVLLAALAVFLGLVHEDRLRRTLLVFDALGLSLFCVMGATIAHEAGLNPVATILLGVTTAVGGGTMRDVVANEVPQIVNPTGVYAAPAFLGAGVTTLVLQLGLFNAVTASAIAAVVLALRLLALRYGWTVPLADRLARSRRTGGAART